MPYKAVGQLECRLSHIYGIPKSPRINLRRVSLMLECSVRMMSSHGARERSPMWQHATTTNSFHQRHCRIRICVYDRLIARDIGGVNTLPKTKSQGGHGTIRASLTEWGTSHSARHRTSGGQGEVPETFMHCSTILYHVAHSTCRQTSSDSNTPPPTSPLFNLESF